MTQLVEKLVRWCRQLGSPPTGEGLDRQYLRDRMWRNRFTRSASMILLVTWVAGWLVVVFTVPLLGNPWYVLDRLRDSELPPSTVTLLAALTPVLVTVLAGFVACSLIAIVGWTSLERRYLSMVEGLQKKMSEHGNSHGAERFQIETPFSDRGTTQTPPGHYLQ
jgi:hypothetical protein